MVSCFVLMSRPYLFLFFFFFNDTATTEIYTLSLHDALPILQRDARTELACDPFALGLDLGVGIVLAGDQERRDRKSTRLNSSHLVISYAVFCLKKKKSRRGFECRPGGHRSCSLTSGWRSCLF